MTPKPEHTITIGPEDFQQVATNYLGRELGTKELEEVVAMLKDDLSFIWVVTEDAINEVVLGSDP